jgi:Protein of unknown function (DUF2591)
MKTTELSDATLDCWVERAKFLRLNQNASKADLDSVSHVHRFSTDPELARPIIECEGIVVEQIDDPDCGTLFLAYRPGAPQVSPFVDDRMSHGDTYLDAAMICYVTSVFGREAEFKML